MQNNPTGPWPQPGFWPYNPYPAYAIPDPPPPEPVCKQCGHHPDLHHKRRNWLARLFKWTTCQGRDGKDTETWEYAQGEDGYFRRSGVHRESSKPCVCDLIRDEVHETWRQHRAMEEALGR